MVTQAKKRLRVAIQPAMSEFFVIQFDSKLARHRKMASTDKIKLRVVSGYEFVERGIGQKKSQSQNFVCSKVTIRGLFLPSDCDVKL